MEKYLKMRNINYPCPHFSSYNNTGLYNISRQIIEFSSHRRFTMSEQNNILNEELLNEISGGVDGMITVPYVVQKGDTVPGLAKRFNTTEKQIMEDNVSVLHGSKTLVPGMILSITKNSKR